MTKEKQRIVIAEFCGWREAFPRHTDLGKERGGILLPYKWEQIGTGARGMEPPNYPEDLNAMNEAECHLKVGQVELFVEELMGLVPKSEYVPRDRLFWFCHATASQRAEAFIKTLGLWEQD